MSARLALLAPLLFAVPVVSGIVATLANLAGTDDPFLGFSTTATSVDAQAVFLGEPLFQDPNDGYTGLPLSPLFPLVLGAIHHLSSWNGWGIVLSAAAGVSLSALAGALGYRGAVAAGAQRWTAAAGAVGIGALAWWLVTFVPIDFLFEARSDQAAWALALGGLVLVPAALDGSRRALLGAVLLLTAGVWTKQPAGAAVLAALLWTVFEAASGRVAGRRAAALAGALVGLNAALLALAAALSSGWAFTFIVEIPARETREQGLVPSTRELLTSTAGAALFAAAVWAAYLFAARHRPPSGRQGPIAGALVLFAALGSLTAVVANTKQGSYDNQFLGVTWALVLLGAIGWGEGAARRGAALAGAAAVALLFALGLAGGVRDSVADTIDVSVPPLRDVTNWVELSPALRDLASSRSVYHPVYSDLNVEPRGEVFPSHVHIQDVLAGGERPGFLVDTLLDRRFDVVYEFDEAERFELYASAYGEQEENFLWKLNRAIEARYRPGLGLPREVRAARQLPDGAYASPSVRVRRPGPERARWMRYCFGPFHIGSETWRIRSGGGFWCRPRGRGPVLNLRATPAAFSEIRSGTGVDRVEGRLTARLRPGGVLEVACVDGEETGLARRFRGPRISVRLSSPVLGDSDCGALSIRASRGSGARVRLDGLRLG